MFKKLDLNWSAVWRKSVVGAVIAAGMGYMYKTNKAIDDQLDAIYPKPSEQAKKNDNS